MSRNSSPGYKALFLKAEDQRKQAEERQNQEAELRKQAEEREADEKTQPTDDFWRVHPTLP